MSANRASGHLSLVGIRFSAARLCLEPTRPELTSDSVLAADFDRINRTSSRNTSSDLSAATGRTRVTGKALYETRPFVEPVIVRDSRGLLRRQPTMTTFHCWLPSLSPTGWCSIIDLLDACVSRTSRSFTPVNSRTVTGFCADNTVQGLASWCTSVTVIESYHVAKQCIQPLTNDLINAQGSSQMARGGPSLKFSDKNFLRRLNTPHRRIITLR